MDDQEGGAVGPLHQPSAGPPPRPGEELRVCAGKNRIVQIAKAGARKLFDAERREVFLEWFAATCNAKLSAERAGVCYQTVFKHRMKDPGFAAAWDEAVAQGYARIEARLVQECTPVIASEAKQSSLDRHGSIEPRDDEESFDPELALLLLREHRRRPPGSPDKRKNLRTTARVATEQEVISALEKRLKGFALRVAKGGKEG